MSDERRKRAAELIAACWCYPDTSHKQMDSILACHAIDAMLAFAAEEVAKERARCAKVCRDLSPTYIKNGQRWMKDARGDFKLLEVAPPP